MMDMPGLTVARQLGEGGTALVARAYSEEFQKEVAIKYPLNHDRASLDEFTRLARRENELIGGLSFPGIVRILSFSMDPPCLQLELCRGLTLDRIDRLEDVSTLLNVISAITAELEFLRLKKLIHCDLKPQNLFLPGNFETLKSNSLFFIKISDFSLGRHMTEPESTRAGHGTVGYAAPETMAQTKTSHRSDLFSLGVIAYQLASGRHPFIGEETDPVKIESRIREEAPEPLADFRSDLSDGFIELVNKLLSKKESERPASAWEVCEELKSFGCRYPYEKVISPSFLLRNIRDFEEASADFLELNREHKERLHTLTGSDVSQLRLLLTANFRRDNLKYVNGRFRFKSDIYWPALLRRQSLHYFSKSPLSARKRIVRAAIVGNGEAASKIGVFDKSDSSSALPGAFTLFHQFLSQAFVRRLSSNYAKLSEERNEFDAAARLYIQAGRLDDAARCAQAAADNLDDVEQRTKAILLISRVLDYAGLLGKVFDVRELLMVKGDLLKAGGLSDKAAETYSYILKLYENREPDKLLAETYRDLGEIYKTKQDFAAGIKTLRMAMEIYQLQADELEISRTLKELGNIYWIDSNLSEALKHYRQALSIQKRIGAVGDAAISLQNMGSIFGMMGRLSRTISILNIALKMNRKVGDEGEIARTLNNLGYAYQLSGNLLGAAESLKESLEINRRIGNKKEVLFNLWNLTEVIVKSGCLGESIDLIKEGLQLSVGLADKPHLGRFNLSMANILSRLGRFSESLGYLEKVGTVANEIDDDVMKTRMLRSKAELYFQIGNYRNATALANSALETALKMNAKADMLDALLVLIKTNGKEDDLHFAHIIADELNLGREKTLVEFSFIQFLLENNSSVNFNELGEKCEPSKFNVARDIEFPWLSNIAAEILIGLNMVQEASSHLICSQKYAHDAGLVIDEISSLILLGKLKRHEGNYEEAFSKYRNALKLCKTVAANISIEEDKKLFMNKPRVTFLAQEIKKLGEMMGAKQKAGA